MARQPIAIAGRSFRTKTELRDYLRSLLYGHEPETPLSGDVHVFLEALLRRHPQAGHKIGPGVREFFIRVNRFYGNNRGFWLRRIDGTETDWSFVECLTPTDARRKFLNACRGAITDQVIAFRDRERDRLGPTMTCPVTGGSLPTASAHVDHCEPDTFEALVERFVRERGIDVERVAVVVGVDGQVQDAFADPALGTSWCEFHAARAVLRLVSPKANLSDLRQRKPP